MNKQETCTEQIEARWESCREDLELFVKAGFTDWEDLDEDDQTEALSNVGNFWDYGLCFDWVEPDNANHDGPSAGYYSWLIMTGGPHSEIRFYGNGSIVFVFKDWFDGAERDCSESIEARTVAQYFSECGIMPNFEGVVSW